MLTVPPMSRQKEHWSRLDRRTWRANWRSERPAGIAMRGIIDFASCYRLNSFRIAKTQGLYVYGIRVANGVLNEAIARSGTRLADLPGFVAPQSAFPTLSGAYRSLDDTLGFSPHRRN
jgi:hypothetical protein